MHPNSQTCAIAVIAKAPRPGHVKTRLQGILQPEEAAGLGSAFLRDTLGNLVLAAAEAPIAPYIAYAPAGQEARFDGMLPPSGRLVLADGGNGDAPGVEGFGRVLLDATRALFALGHPVVCMVGADSPTLPTAALVRAARLLLEGAADVVLGPADDGGYYLIGLNAPHAAPYAGIAWSTETVAAETTARVRAAGLRLTLLEEWYDIDDPAALMRLLRDLGTHPRAYGAPHTAAWVETLLLAERL
jgi:rSAM/selenodomain-associated transferase 1